MSGIEILLKDLPLDGVKADFSSTLGALSDRSSRKIAYFDELFTGFVLLSKLPEESVEDITVDINVQDLQTDSVVHTVTLHLPQPLLSNEDQTKSIYNFKFFLPFPKVKLGDPVLKIRAQTSLTTKSEDDKKLKIKTLKSLYPAQRRNVLEGINHSILHHDTSIVLSDALIKNSKHEFVFQEAELQSIKTTDISNELSLPVIRTLSVRLRNIKLKTNCILSTIDIEQSSKSKELGLEITLTDINFKFQGSATLKYPIKLPLEIAKDDSYCFTYELQSTDQVNYKSMVEVSCLVNRTHKIQTKLLTNSDFTQATPFKRASASSLNVNNIGSLLNIRIKGNKIIKLGEASKLRVSIENKSTKERSMLMVFNASNSDHFVPNLPKIKALIQPYHQILKNYTSLRIKNLGVLSLVNEVHFKIPPEQVFENEIELMGLEVGVFNVQGVKLIDLLTGDSINCDRLLEIIVDK